MQNLKWPYCIKPWFVYTGSYVSRSRKWACRTVPTLNHSIALSFQVQSRPLKSGIHQKSTCIHRTGSTVTPTPISDPVHGCGMPAY